MTQTAAGTESDPRAARRKLPIGVQTFREIREEGCYYVDKTPFIRRLVDEGKHYFLSRPRRFGKSLLVDTIKELFEGNEPLFRGLSIHDRWDWSTPRPVIRLDFGGGSYGEPDLAHKEAAARDGLAQGAAMAQLRERGYADKYRGSNRPIHLIAVEFSKETRNLAAFEAAPA